MKRIKFEDLTGNKFGLWTVLGYSGRKEYRNQWKCRCFCGSEKVLSDSQLNKSKSCGCRRKGLFTTGQKISDLKILGDFIYEDRKYKWLCECECGSIVYKSEEYLRNNCIKHKTCGCLKSSRKINIGDIFGNLEVIDCHNCGKWLCKCNCGNIKVVSEQSIFNRKIKTCGFCDRLKNMKEKFIGKTFFQLKVLDFEKKVGYKYYWKCMCDCGNITIATTQKLGRRKSCGCLWRKSVVKHGLYGTKEYNKYLLSDPVRKLKRYVGNRIRESLKTRGGFKGGHTFDYLPYTPQELKIHLEKMWEPWMNWDNYGGFLNDIRKTWHVDHVIPHCKFNYKSLEDVVFKECWSLSNLKPMEKIANCKKRCN